jgi:hypothetical protein
MRLLVAALLLTFAFVALSVPHGGYCGGIQDVVTLNITVISLTTINLQATVFDTPLKPCVNERVVYYAGMNLASVAQRT